MTGRWIVRALVATGLVATATMGIAPSDASGARPDRWCGGFCWIPPGN
jgi:hypothetical protein